MSCWTRRFLLACAAPGRPVPQNPFVSGETGAGVLGGGGDPAVGRVEAGGSGRQTRAGRAKEEGPPSLDGGGLRAPGVER